MTPTIKKYGTPPFTVGLLHGGPGAAGEMRPVAEALVSDRGVLEFLQTADSVGGQVNELYSQLTACSDKPLMLVGYSWGAWLGVLFAAKLPDWVRKLILVSSGAFESRYNTDLMNVRLNRLSVEERAEAENILTQINAGNVTSEQFSRFGTLMEKADAYRLLPETVQDKTEPDTNIFERVWSEADALRKSGKLLEALDELTCPVVAIHGNEDPHPSAGVEEPLSERVRDFRMIRLEKCGHTPWKEACAKETFYRILKEEIQ